eukprot:TRINITY_DN66921_c0_g1_i2.p1 TRINITY_DN66921_c0_g1~~TRINITY_DN66921_c0_g1_i2.p1  ORF type:complete len:451 (+),score=84.09 TRINITY_DN66921_c0_g1_i2:51-1403(+)
MIFLFFFFSSRRRHTRCREVSWARRCVQETGINAEYMGGVKWVSCVGIISFGLQQTICFEMLPEITNSLNLLLLGVAFKWFLSGLPHRRSFFWVAKGLFLGIMEIQLPSVSFFSVLINTLTGVLLKNVYFNQEVFEKRLVAYRNLWKKARKKAKMWKRIFYTGQSDLKVIIGSDCMLFANDKFLENFEQDFGQMKEEFSGLFDRKGESLWSSIEKYMQIDEENSNAFNLIGEFGKKGCKYFEVNIKKFPYKHRDDSFIIALHDITATKANQKELLSKHYRSILVTTASHELMTPMNGILGSLQLIENCDTMEDVRHCCKVMSASCKLLLNTTNCIVDYCKYESGKLMLDCEECNLKELMEEAIATIEVQTKERGVTVELDYGPDIPTKIYIDKKRLMQIFLNLLFNAAKYTFKGNIKFSATNQVKSVLISVEDTGIGISENGKNLSLIHI